jgi:hypothetical protein
VAQVIRQWAVDKVQADIIKLNNIVQSNYSIVKTGIPQGSILGPLLFLFFANNSPIKVRNFKLITFADNTTLLFIHPIQTNIFEMLKNYVGTINSRFQAFF